MLKRYDITGVHGRGGVFSAKAIETPDGEFIRYKDYMKEQVGNVPQANACPQLYDVRALGEAICDMEKYISDESSMLGEKYKKVVEKYNKVSEHFIQRQS